MKQLVSFVFTIILAISTFASEFTITSTEAKDIARKAWHSYGPGAEISGMELIPEIHDLGEILLIEYPKGTGFLILSKDKRALPILAYGFEGPFKEYADNTSLNYLIEGYKSEIQNLNSSGKKASEAVVNAWDLWTGSKPIPPVLSISPLLNTNWGQGCYYNADCPIDTSATGYYCYRTPTGCVATTMAQIMRYHAYPDHGIGTHSYAHSQYGNLSANFAAATYDWNQMPQNLTNPAPEVAEIMFHCGVSVNMDYGPVSSGSYASDARAALVYDFDYAATTLYRQRVNYTDPVWHGFLKTDLDNGRPIFYGGVDPNGFGGHAWVVDGYQGNYYHINWGWDGAHNGYFLLSALDPQGNANFTNFHEAITGIEPASPGLKAQFALNTDTLEIGDTAYFTDLSTGNVLSWNWTFYTQGSNISSTQQNPNLTYSNGGEFDVQLIVSDGSTSDTLLKELAVVVLPLARLSSDKHRTTYPAGDINFFDQSVSNDPIISWSWEFGLPGSGCVPASSGYQNPSGVKFPPGLHPVSLEVNTLKGSSLISYAGFIESFSSCDTFFSASVPAYYVNPVDQASFIIGNYDLDGLTPYYAGAGHPSTWHIYNDVIAPGDTNFFYGSTSWFQTPGQADNWLVFGPLTLPTGGAFLEWKHLFWLNNKRDAYEVLVSDIGGYPGDFPYAPIMAFIDNDPHTEGHTDWVYQSAYIDSLAFGGKQVWIAFHHFGNDMAYVFLDDFFLTWCAPWTGMDDPRNIDQSLNIYPNPVNDHLSITELDASNSALLSIYSLDGHLLWEESIEQGVTSVSINLKDFSPGQYLLVYSSGNKVLREMFVKL